MPLPLNKEALNPGVIIGAGVRAYYIKVAGILRFECKRCKKHICDVAVAAGDTSHRFQ